MLVAVGLYGGPVLTAAMLAWVIYHMVDDRLRRKRALAESDSCEGDP
jgi:hypothetical protein